MFKYLLLLVLIGYTTFGAFAQIDVIDSLVSLRGISVLDKDNIWVSGSLGTIAKTTDGGKTWEKLKIPNVDSLDFRDIEVFSQLEAIAMSAGEGKKSNVYRTVDGGASWTLVYANSFEKGFFNGISFKNRAEGVLTGDPVDGKLFVMQTKDGGATWVKVDPNKLPDLRKGEFGGYAASGSHLIYQDDYFINCTGGDASRVFIGNSKLESWQVVSTPISQGGGSSGVFSIDFCDSNNGVAVGGDYTTEDEGLNNVIITKDGGLNWILAESFPVYQSSVRFVDCQIIVSTGPKGTYLSTDSGMNWKKTIYDGYHTLDIAVDGSVWAAGSKGRVTKIDIN